MKILLVDDEERNLKLLIDMLFPLNHTLLKAMDGKNALEIIRQNSDTDLVLLDIMMPDMDGYEVCTVMKADNALKDIPIIFITALSDEASQIKGLKCGAVDYVTKPFKKEILRARVNTQLELKQKGDALKNTIHELNEALANIKTLKSLLPICASCKKIREDEGYWTQVDTYIASHTDTQFSHGICPDCVRKLYPDIADQVLKGMDEAKQTKIDKSQT